MIQLRGEPAERGSILIGEVGEFTDRLPVVALLSSEARMPLPGCEMKEAVRFSSSVYGLVLSNSDVITICCGGGRRQPGRCIVVERCSHESPRNTLRCRPADAAIAIGALFHLGMECCVSAENASSAFATKKWILVRGEERR